MAGARQQARTAVREGAYVRVLRGVNVSSAEDPASPEVRVAGPGRVLPPEVAVSHRSALWVLGEDVLTRRGGLDVTVARGRHLLARPGITTHTAALAEHDLVDLDGLLVVCAARAVVDVARPELLPEAVAFGDRAPRSGAAELARIEQALGEAHGLRGVLRAHAAVPLFDGRSESWTESRLRVSLHLGGLRGLDVQYDLYDDEGHVARGDLHLRGAWLDRSRVRRGPDTRRRPPLTPRPTLDQVRGSVLPLARTACVRWHVLPGVASARGVSQPDQVDHRGVVRW